MNMKKLLLTLITVLTVSLYLSPVAKAQQPCSANFQYVIGTVTPNGATVQFYDSSFTVGTITNWNWSFGNGTGSNLEDPIASLNPGWNSVCLAIVAVYQSQTCTSTFCDSIYIGNTPPPCNSTFTYTVGSLGVAFAATTGTNVQWTWDFGDGSTGTGANPVHTYAVAGSYVVCLTVLDANGTVCTSCQTITVGGTPPCDPTFTYNAGPQGVMFNSAGNTTNTSWVWSFGDGTAGTGANVFHTYTTAGVYTVCLVVINSAGVSCTSCQTVTVGSSAGCQAYYTSASVPGTMIVNFTDQSQGNATDFWWSFGDGSTSTLQNPSHTYTSTGWFNVCLTITDSAAGCYDTFCDSLYVGTNFLCDPTFSIQNAPATTVFIANAQNAIYTWDFGDGSVGTGGPTIIHNYAAPGTYTACLTVTTSAGTTCTSCQTVTIQNGNGCSSNFAIYPDSITPHTYYAYNLASGVAPLTYIWSWGDGTSSNTAYPSHTYAQSGLYTICLTITDATGCSSNTCYQWQLLRLSGSSIPVTINVVPGSVGLNEQDIFSGMTVFPNPASDLISTSFNLAKEASINVSVVNLAGQKVYSLPSTVYGIGMHEIKMDVTGLAKGIYMIQIQGEGFKSNQKVVVQ